jgi:hypothetical protein
MKKSPIAYLLLLTNTACPSQGPTEPKPIPVGGSCAEAYTHLTALKCEWSVSKKGHTFQEVCENAAQHGIDLKPACVTHAATCEEAKGCGQ